MDENVHDTAVLVIAMSKDGRMVVVRDPSFGFPFWKIPGGHKEEGENPAEAASRELREETGIEIPWRNLSPISSGKAEGHFKYIYFGIVHSWKWLLKTGSDGEEVMLVPARKVLKRKDFLVQHRGIVEMAMRFIVKNGFASLNTTSSK